MQKLPAGIEKQSREVILEIVMLYSTLRGYLEQVVSKHKRLNLILKTSILFRKNKTILSSADGADGGFVATLKK